MRSMLVQLRAHLLAAVVLLVLGGVGSAQPNPADPLDAAFGRMMAQPGNADAALDYARIAASRGETGLRYLPWNGFFVQTRLWTT